jgi:putative ABC transport system permease protein
MLSIDFFKLIVTAFILSCPLAWIVMSKWLQDFAYRVNLSWWIFLVSGLIASMIGIFAICFQAIKAAIANPVKNLRTE